MPTNHEKYFGTPVDTWLSIEHENWLDMFNRWYYLNGKTGYKFAYLVQWLESEAEE